MQGITLGIADILAAEQIILVATGAAKAAAISAMINGPKTPDCPASLLRDHPDIRLFLDKEAASQIS
jgi:glucosamine-6-phosphate deaminase